MTTASPAKAAALSVLLVGFALLVLLIPLPRSWPGSWQSRLCDLGHVPLFAALTLGLLWIWRPVWLWPPIMLLAGAGLVEVVQGWLGRSGSLLDFLRGALGILVGLVAFHACRPPRTFPRMLLHALVIAVLVLWPILDIGPSLLDTLEGYQALPTLADFQTSRQMERWTSQQAVLTRVADTEQPGHWLGRLEFLPGPQDYPGAILVPVAHDWNPYARICCSLVVEGQPLELVFSVRGGPDAAGETSHYQAGRKLDAGRHVIALNLSAIAPQAEPKPLDLTYIFSFQIYSFRPEHRRAIFIERIWLE